MQTLPLFEQLSRALPAPEQIRNWSKFWHNASSLPANGAAGQAITASVETLLDGASELRHMQLDAIHKAQRRTAHLARALGEARDPAKIATTLQTYAQENLQEAIAYWDNYRRIVQDTELHLIASGDDEAPAPKKATGKKRAAS